MALSQGTVKTLMTACLASQLAIRRQRAANCANLIPKCVGTHTDILCILIHSTSLWQQYVGQLCKVILLYTDVLKAASVILLHVRIQVYAYIHIDIRTQRVARCLEMPPRVSYTVELKCFTYVFRSPYEVVCLQDHAVMRRQQNASAAKFSSIIRLSAGVCRELVVCDTDKTVSNDLRKSCILHTQSIVSNQGKRLL